MAKLKLTKITIEQVRNGDAVLCRMEQPWSKTGYDIATYDWPEKLISQKNCEDITDKVKEIYRIS